MKAFFVGGITDNSELEIDLAGRQPPANYPPNSGSGIHRYQLQRTVMRDEQPLYAVYAPPEMSAAEVDQIVSERGYDRRFAGQSPG